MTAARRHRGQARRKAPPRQPPDFGRLFRGLLSTLLGLLLLSSVGYGTYFGSQWLMEPGHLPVRRLRIVAPLNEVTLDAVREVVRPHAREGILQLDVDEVRDELESLSWVRRAEVRRSWPDVLVIDIREFDAVAQWSDGSLVSNDGVRFTPGEAWRGAAALPKLDGPAGSEQTLIAHYRSFSQQLAGSGLAIRELIMDERHAWRLILADGVQVLLGRGGHELRLARLQEIYHDILKTDSARLERLDLRYTNGFAVKWRGETPAAGA